MKKLKVHLIVNTIEYCPQSDLSKTIIKKITGNITVSSIAKGEKLAEKMIAFDNYVQIIDGSAELIVNKKKHKLKLGEGIIIPANSKHSFNAIEQFKMISTIIKSGYED